MLLTKKEVEVLKLKKQGFTQNEMAKRLKISQPAVSNFFNNALKKIRDANDVLKMAREVNINFEKP